MKTTILLFASILMALTSYSMGADYDVLCTDNAKNLLNEKINYIRTKTGKPAVKVKHLKKLPPVLSHQADIKVLGKINYVYSQVARYQGDFNKQLEVQEVGMKYITAELKKSAPQYLSKCNRYYSHVYGQCNGFLKSKDFKNYSSCVSNQIAKNQKFLDQLTPYKNFSLNPSKKRSIAKISLKNKQKALKKIAKKKRTQRKRVRQITYRKSLKTVGKSKG